MNQMLISSLEKEIEETKNQLRAKKLLLIQLKREAKPSFHETKMGRSWTSFLNKSTEPFAKLNSRTKHALEDPIGFQLSKLEGKGEKILEKCKQVVDRERQDATHLALAAADIVIKLEASSSKSNLVKKLDEQVQRLRPEKKEKVCVPEVTEIVTA